MDGNLSFNGNSLQTFDISTGTGIITNVIDHAGGPNKTAPIYSVANSNASAIPYVDYPSKSITISGSIAASTPAALDELIDSFKSYLNGIDKNLDINYAGGTRRYVATATGISITRTGALLHAPFSVSFVCTQPYGSETTPTEMFNEEGISSAVITKTTAIAGTAMLQLPVFTITINSLTGTGDYVQLSNDANGQELLIYGQGLAATDILVIDCEARTVTKNGVEIDYSGTFLELDSGETAEITYTDGFTTRDVDWLAEYTKKYL